MQKQKRWHLFLIFCVILLTIYNILPTVFYYSKPLKKPVLNDQALNVAKDIEKRINFLEKDAIRWLDSYCKLLKTSYQTIEINKENPQQIEINFKKEIDAKKFKKSFPKAGALIPFVPSQLSLIPQNPKNNNTTVYIQRKIPVHFDVKNTNDYFEYISKSKDNKPTKKYRHIIFDRVASLAVAMGGISENFDKITKLKNNPQIKEDLLYSLSQDLIDYRETFKENSSITKRYFSTFTQGSFNNREEPINFLIDSISQLRDEVKIKKLDLKKKNNEKQLKLENAKEIALMKAEGILKRQKKIFTSGQIPYNYNTLVSLLEKNYNESLLDNTLKLKIGLKNPIIKEIIIDWSNDKIFLKPHDDIIAFKENLKKESLQKYEQIIINEIAKITRNCDEKISSYGNEFIIKLNELSGNNSFLILKLEKIAKNQLEIAKNILKNSWHPLNEELSQQNYPVYDYETYLKLPKQDQTLCFVVCAPILNSNISQKLHSNSVYIIAKGLDRILKKYQNNTSSLATEQLSEDFNSLRELFRQNGYMSFAGAQFLDISDFKNDYIFEKNNYYDTILKASRENFNVYGSKKFAVLEFSDLEGRLLTLNKIQTQMHEDLIKWKDEYNTSQVALNGATKYDVPSPTKNLFLNNLILSAKKYFRGDERKILHWGLDLSGGKTVQLELKDQNNKVVKDEEALKQGINELYNRVNKMGVSDVSIRTVDSNIVLDFPGAQNLSAAELVKASSMYFNVVNEKFSFLNDSLAVNVSRFLQEVWNEAVVTNRKDIESVNAIARKHLYGDELNHNAAQPRSEAAKILYENGLRLALNNEASSSFFDTALSKIAIFREENQRQITPLLIVFNNHALEGSSLNNVRASYDPSKGNFLSFEIGGSQTIEGKKFSSRNMLHEWTSHFSTEKVVATSLKDYSRNKGWRMAVILNDSIISAPNLESALRDSAMITGSFTQREVNKLVADLKAGSLTFTPHILSEKNVSPELGQKEKTKGIIATIIALLTIIITMISYYRFSGLVASVAVVINLLIMWAILQNVSATLSLAGIAGIILTVGMAVDANVLIFERIKEEFAITGKIFVAIHEGYKKAFTAILDSNITTFIAALILLNFDAGPIKGFAITLIIGIASSMFCALFMTRFFFFKWVQNPKNTKLKMSNLFKTPKFNFLKNSKYVIGFSLILIIFGCFVLVKQNKSVLGMDFTGGFSLNIELAENAKENYRSLATEAFLSKGLSSQDFQIRELNNPNNLRLLFGTSMELHNKPFHNMPLSLDKKDVIYSYQNNPRINWIISALTSNGLKIKERNLESLDKSFTSMSGQMSDNMRNNALLGLGLTLICILMYITWRFEFKFAISAILCLLHDVLISIGTIALLNYLKVPVQIDLHTVAALMTIVGYSINDTIIIFDRIREDSKLMRKSPFKEIVNHALNVTLSRTSITSVTTLLVLLALVIFGGSTIFSFALVMSLGVIFGTLSSIFIASPLMLFFHKLEQKRQNRYLIKEK